MVEWRISFSQPRMGHEVSIPELLPIVKTKKRLE